jgi:hypothetical protein
MTIVNPTNMDSPTRRFFGSITLGLRRLRTYVVVKLNLAKPVTPVIKFSKEIRAKGAKNIRNRFLT